MLPQAQEHIAAVERKDRSEREEQLARQSREAEIRHYQNAIRDAERRITDPVFVNDEAESVYRILHDKIERLSAEYERSMHRSRLTAQPFPHDFASEHAICYFLGDLILEKLPLLADRITSRDGRGCGFNEAKRDRITAECGETIKRNTQLLSDLTERVSSPANVGPTKETSHD